MAEIEPMQTLRDVAAAYLTSQAYDPEGLKDYLEREGNEETSDAVQFALAETLAGDGLDQQTWEEATDDDYEDGDDWIDALTALFEYLFEDGPLPLEDADEDEIDDTDEDGDD